MILHINGTKKKNIAVRIVPKTSTTIAFPEDMSEPLNLMFGMCVDTTKEENVWQIPTRNVTVIVPDGDAESVHLGGGILGNARAVEMSRDNSASCEKQGTGLSILRIAVCGQQQFRKQTVDILQF